MVILELPEKTAMGKHPPEAEATDSINVPVKSCIDESASVDLYWYISPAKGRVTITGVPTAPFFLGVIFTTVLFLTAIIWNCDLPKKEPESVNAFVPFCVKLIA